MATETDVQSVVHNLEEGKWRGRVKFVLVVSVIAAISCIFIIGQFRGLSHSKAMDQAQVARELARGNGFTTKFIRPCAMTQLLTNKGAIPPDRFPDTYNAPLNPWINSLFLPITKSSWIMTTKSDPVYSSDRLLAIVSVLFFILSIGVNYLTARRLFDERLAFFAAWAMIICEPFWQYAISGLPQMLMLLLFSGAVYMLVRATEAKQEGGNPTPWIALAGLLFGLLALAHGLTVWIFMGALLFTAFLFRPLGKHALIMLLVFAACYAPWMVRNYSVCGSPFGLAPYTVFYTIRGSESKVMRATELVLTGLTPISFRNKIQDQTLLQLGNLYRDIGFNFVALTFFITLLHIYKRPLIGQFRWGILLMFLFAVLGMSVFGCSDEDALKSNNLTLLFAPVMTFYGMAYILYLWSQWQINIRVLNIAFVVLIYGLLGLPLLRDLLIPPGGMVQWPPYIPPYISLLNKWTNDNEIIASDMPWGVAWYADRKSLWLPLTINDFIAFNDYNRLGDRLIGLYLTPVSGNQSYRSAIIDGDYREWAPFITRSVSSKDFPLRAATGLPINGECVFYSDRDRWSGRTE